MLDHFPTCNAKIPHNSLLVASTYSYSKISHNENLISNNYLGYQRFSFKPPLHKELFEPKF